MPVAGLMAVTCGAAPDGEDGDLELPPHATVSNAAQATTKTISESRTVIATPSEKGHIHSSPL
jgi:hypothetical protein